jgi:hypothetical protein
MAKLDTFFKSECDILLSPYAHLVDDIAHVLISAKTSQGSTKMPAYGGRGIPGFFTAVSSISDYKTKPLGDVEIFDDQARLILATNDDEKADNLIKHNAYNTSSGIVQNITTGGITLPEIARTVFQDWPVEDFIPIRQGFGAWKTDIYQYAAQPIGAEQFRKGLKGQGQTSSSNLVNVQLFQQTVKLQAWSQGYQYDIFEANSSLANGIPLDVIAEKIYALMEMFKYGRMETAFLGIPDSPNGQPFPGLFNNPDVTLNTAVMVNSLGMPTKMSDMTDLEFILALQNIANAYIANVQETHKMRPANIFAIPEDERVALAGEPLVITNALVNLGAISAYAANRLAYMEIYFKMIFGSDFKIHGTSYLQANSFGVESLGYYAYMLYRKDPNTLEMIESIPFTLASMATPNGVHFIQMAYAQFSHVFFKRPQEAIIFQVA